MLLEQTISFNAVPSSEGGMILLPTYLLTLPKRFLEACRTREEGRVDNLKVETRHGDIRYRVWLAQPRIDYQITIEQSFEGCSGWIIAHRYNLVK